MLDLLDEPSANTFDNQWMIYDYSQPADNDAIRIDAKYDVGNVNFHDGVLQMKQKGYSDADLAAKRPISMSGIQSRRVDIIHGTFRSVFKVEGSDGGSCASFFWYRNDASEIDIEAVTRGTSFVSNTISYTTQPSVNADGSPIGNASLKIPLSSEYNTDVEIYHEHRFDCDPDNGVKYYLDGQLKHFDFHNIPKEGGNLQMKLWADGNKWWSGHPSKTTVTMSVKSLIAYFNTSGTEDGTDTKWFTKCQKAGGPSDATICTAFAETGHPDETHVEPPNTTAENNGRTRAPPLWCSSGGILYPCPPQSNQATRKRVFWADMLLLKSNRGARRVSEKGQAGRGMTQYLPEQIVGKSQANRVNLPSWFSLDYARNSSTVVYQYLASVRRGNVRLD